MGHDNRGRLLRFALPLVDSVMGVPGGVFPANTSRIELVTLLAVSPDPFLCHGALPNHFFTRLALFTSSLNLTDDFDTEVLWDLPTASWVIAMTSSTGRGVRTPLWVQLVKLKLKSLAGLQTYTLSARLLHLPLVSPCRYAENGRLGVVVFRACSRLTKRRHEVVLRHARRCLALPKQAQR